jgi:predicted PurR-regulated permease PerM
MQKWNKTFIVTLILITAGLLYLLAPILTPFLIGTLLAYLVNPLITQLVRLKIPRLLSVIIVFVILFAIIILLLFLLIPLVQSQIEALTDVIPNIIAWGQNTILPWISNTLGTQPTINVATIKSTLIAHWAKTEGIAGQFFNTVLHSSVILAQWLLNIVLIPVVTFYLLRDSKKITQSIRNYLPRSIEPTVIKLLKECDSVLSSFFRGQFLVMLSLGIIYSIGLTVVGLQIGLILGLVIGLISIVPYLGMIIGITVATIAAFVQFGDLKPVLFVWLVFAIGQMIESMFLTPNLIGDRIGLHPVAVIFAVLAGGSLCGFFGVLLALPVAAVIMVWLRFLTKHYQASGLYK